MVYPYFSRVQLIHREPQWRIYYVDKENTLAEIAKSGDGNWSLGKLGRSKHFVAPKSALAAGVDDNGVRLYFQRNDLGTIMTTFSSKSKPNWSAATEAAKLF